MHRGSSPFARSLAAVAIAAAFAAGCSRIESEQFRPQVEKIVEATPRSAGRDALGKRVWAAARQFYESREYTPAWIDGHTPTRQLDELLDVLGQARTHGVEPARYDIENLKAARAQADEAWIGASFEEGRVADLDVRLTMAFFTYAADLLGWATPPKQVDPNWLAPPAKVDLAERLRAALDGNNVRDALEALAPTHPQYRGLQRALARFRREENTEAADRVAMNMERWRWAPRDLGDRHILINVPTYQMQIVEGDKPVLAMRVIVGAPETPTPLFSDKMTYVVFSPFWNIPESILREETLPRLMEDPDYLVRNNMEVVGTTGEVIDPMSVDWMDEEATKGVRFRQMPGPDNALGLVKFIFPNHFSVYLHDTPGDALFKKEKRTLSHGCIRVEQPVALAEYVLGGRTWTRDRIVAAMNARTEQAVTLTEPLPVHIGYWTAWVEEDGEVIFTDDPYGLDRKHARVRARLSRSSTARSE